MDRDGGTLSISRQCRLLSLGRTSLYYHAVEDKELLALMRRIDELFTEDPTRGVKRMCSALRKDGLAVRLYRVRRLFGRMGLSAIYCKPRLSNPHPGHK
ncbi:MAG: IS3 family transposase [Chitinispirillales bacterium]|nr:IS3 family transposase [Chitinispirillales bacterium]